MKTKILKVKITFLEPVLGTWPSNQNVARDFIASKSPDAATIEDEVAALGADMCAELGNGIVLTSLLSRGTGSHCSAAQGKGKAQLESAAQRRR